MMLVTGASGFVGSAVVRLARSRGLAVRAMVQPQSRLDLLEGVPADSIVRADMTEIDSLRRAVEGVRAVVHCAATTSVSAPDLELSRRVNVEGTDALLRACREAGARRFVNIGSQSAHKGNPSVYGRTKLEQDERVMGAEGIEWTILRPSIVYGAQAKGVFSKMADYCRKLPVIPVIGPGREEMRPIHVDDVAWAALACIEESRTVGRIYDLGGADVLEFNEFISEILAAIGKRKPCFHLPIPIALAIARTLSAVMKNPPLTPDNVTGIQTARHVSNRAAREDFGFAPRGFAQGLREIYGRKGREMATSPSAGDGGSAPSRTVRLAVVGLGKMGVMHSAMCGAAPGVSVGALMDADPKLGSQVQSMGVDAPFFSSLDAMFDKARDLDGVVIATPQFTHREIAVACLERGLHVFCEKPLAHTLDDARAMAEAQKTHPDRVTAIGFMKGHYPLWLEAARRLRDGWIGPPRRFRATVYLSQVLSPKKGWTFTKDLSGGGILINSGIHLVHFLRVLFGDVERVTARSRPMHSQVEDTLAALVEFRSGVFGSYDTSWSVAGYETEGTTVLVEGDEGTLEIADDWLRTYHLTGAGGAPKGWSRTHRAELDHAAFTMSPDYGGEGYYNQIEDFARAIREGGRARYDWTEGLRVQEVVDALYRSCESGKTIAIGPI
ncbi:NAD-dependent epimerase/dehydratase family protein [Candidatus Sumerlaeota bacterium]|nr:NAD-dependent epimerase/dehydratase family protein [Candidatus Sumerlaeota bacterium]